MNRNKKILLLFTVIFFVIVIAVSYDIARKTTFPGSKSQLKERIKKEYIKNPEKDAADSVEVTVKKQD